MAKKNTNRHCPIVVVAPSNGISFWARVRTRKQLWS